MSGKQSTHGVFGWNELMTSDPEGAKAFYRELLGWQLEDVPMEGFIYTLIRNGDEQIGGVMGMPPDAGGAPPHWGAYVTVDDVDQRCARAQSLGAQILVPPTDIPNVGRFCVVRDPQGAALSLITYLPCDSPAA